METQDTAPRSRGSYFVATGEVTEFKNQADLKTHLAEHSDEVLQVFKGKTVEVTVENKPVVSLNI